MINVFTAGGTHILILYLIKKERVQSESVQYDKIVIRHTKYHLQNDKIFFINLSSKCPKPIFANTLQYQSVPHVYSDSDYMLTLYKCASGLLRPFRG